MRAPGATVSPDEVQAVGAARRILLLGCPGAGKTRLARALGQRLALPVVHLDALFWRPGWVSTPAPEWTARVQALAAEPEWIIDGTYERSLPARLARAEVAIVLEASRWVCLLRVVWRRLFDAPDRPDAPPGQPLNLAFLRYIWRYGDESGRAVVSHIAGHGGHVRVIRLHHRTGVRQLRRALDAAEQRQPAHARATDG